MLVADADSVRFCSVQFIVNPINVDAEIATPAMVYPLRYAMATLAAD